MSVIETFELRRQVDGLVYRFHRGIALNGRPGYRREDRDLWIVWDARRGWISTLPENGDLTGRPWDVAPEEQDESAPPEGAWVSRKGERSYVYDLIYA